MLSPLGLFFGPGVDGIASKIANGVSQYRVVAGKAIKSLFSSAQFSPYPKTVNKKTGNVESITDAGDIHKDEANDSSINSIIEYTNQVSSDGKPLYPGMRLDYIHFAYLKKLGVYPNNRLIIARRFASGVANDLTQVTAAPLSTLVSYFDDSEDTFKISFNESWTDAEGGFEDVLNDIGEDILQGDNKGGKLGTGVANAFGVIPLPAITEGLQLEVLNRMGLSGAGQGSGSSPYGNPNIIREAKQRAILKKGSAGSGLATDIAITMKVEYEQKFINGLDPTLVYMDLIQNALSFGTSDAAFQFSSAFASGATGLIAKLISGDWRGIISAIQGFVSSLIKALEGVVTSIVQQLIDIENSKPSPDEKRNPKDDAIAKYQAAGAEILKKIAKITVGTVVSKYKVRLLGITHALTGSPSCPWHITIGNPKKPVFCSGDMLLSKVSLSLGKVMAFNDLPSHITLDLTFENARALGAQEIFNRLNTGRGRSYVRYNKSFVELSESEIEEESKKQIDAENANKNADTQNKKANIENSKPASEPDKKNEQTNTDPIKVKDELPVKEGDKSAAYGNEKSLTDTNTAKVGEPTGASPSNTVVGTTPQPSQPDVTPANTPGLSASPGLSSSVAANQPENVTPAPKPPAQNPEPDWKEGELVLSATAQNLDGSDQIKYRLVQAKAKNTYTLFINEKENSVFTAPDPDEAIYKAESIVFGFTG